MMDLLDAVQTHYTRAIIDEVDVNPQRICGPSTVRIAPASIASLLTADAPASVASSLTADAPAHFSVLKLRENVDSRWRIFVCDCLVIHSTY